MIISHAAFFALADMPPKVSPRHERIAERACSGARGAAIKHALSSPHISLHGLSSCGYGR